MSVGIARGFPKQAPRVLAQSGIPFILAGGTAGGSSNQFTMGNNGAISTLPVLPTAYSGGAFIYMPASGIFAGSTAGWYWFVASSTTAGTVYNNTYTSGDPKLSVPATPTPFVSTGPGLVTQTTGSFVYAPTLTLPANSMGPNGALKLDGSIAVNNNANNKFSQFEFGSMTMQGGHASTTGYRQLRNVYNAGSVSVNKGHNAWAPGTTTSMSYGSVNTAADVVVRMGLQIANATDYILMDAFDITVQYGA